MFYLLTKGPLRSRLADVIVRSLETVAEAALLSAFIINAGCSTIKV